MGAVIFLMARALPRLQDNIQPPRGPGFFDRLFAKIPMSQIDTQINSFLARSLRKLKVLVLKIDNFINDRLGKLTKKSGGAGDDKKDDGQRMI